MKLFGKHSQSEAYAKELASLLVRQPVIMRRTEGYWFIAIGARYLITTDTWRLIGAKSIITTSDDDGHQFGLPAPVDAEAKANEALADKRTAAVEMDVRTGDCTLRFEEALSLQILTMSSGYETWQLYREGEFFGAVGNEGLR
ncbi:hypothetical protein [uncultured Erythrobacter sp.]|uniref:hypothetical protein n=1 Tax=uncultured Erythrobacter sp. TaxID=263913 RepID=UPI002658B354|nr:hypothetical protein [uncultured Erythrobacter sp.]